MLHERISVREGGLSFIPEGRTGFDGAVQLSIRRISSIAIKPTSFSTIASIVY